MVVCIIIFDWVNDKGIGFLVFIFLGNVSDIDFVDLFDIFSIDKYIDVILLYVDMICDVWCFMFVVCVVFCNWWIFVLKGGCIKVGRKVV